MKRLVLSLVVAAGFLTPSPAQELGGMWGTARAEADYYRIVQLPLPSELALEVGSFCTLPDGRLAIGTRRGQILLVTGAFDELPLAPEGTPFQLAVWRALCDIPWGETRSYRELAVAVGSPRAARAVGMANHHNPLGVIVPCHRVVAADGTLGGYGGGVERKEWLLVHEGAWSQGTFLSHFTAARADVPQPQKGL